MAGGVYVAVRNGDFPISRGVSEVIHTGTVERKVCEERKKDLECSHDALVLLHLRWQVKLETE